MKSVCYELGLFSLNAHAQGPDAIEREFFGEVDFKGAEARDRLLTGGPESLSPAHRVDFARLLLSLDARRPQVVRKLREAGPPFLAEVLDSDPELQDAMKAQAIAGVPSDLLGGVCGGALEDRSLGVLQSLVDNPVVGTKLINAQWHIVRLDQTAPSLVLSDRPLIRIFGYDHPNAVWAMPLTPRDAFIAANQRQILDRFKRLTGQRFAKQMNISSAHQADRFIFSIDATHERWLSKHLDPRMKSAAANSPRMVA